MAERNRLVKMVRDRIQGEREAEYRSLGVPGSIEHVLALRKKLIEEATEYVLEPSIHELGDVLEVVRALADWDIGFPFYMVEDEADLKRGRKGGFDEANGMYVSVKEPGVL